MPHQWLKQFVGRVKRIEAARGRADDLYSSRTLSKGDTESIYEALFLRLVTTFESYLEDIFFATLRGDLAYPKARVTCEVAFRIKTIAESFVLVNQARPFIDWLPYDKTIDLAKRYFKNGGQFDELDGGKRKEISDVVVIRNAIAHQSDYAWDKFEKQVLGGKSLLAHERTPAGYLRSIARLAPRATRFELLTSELASAAQLLYPVKQCYVELPATRPPRRYRLTATKR